MTSAGCQPVQTLARPTQNRAELGARRESLVDGELLAQGQVLEGELAVAADEEGEEAEHVEYEGDHEARLWPDGADRSITYRVDGVLAKDRRPDADSYSCCITLTSLPSGSRT